MKKILVVFAMNEEKKPIVDYFDKSSDWKHKEEDVYKYGDIVVKVASVGIGKVNSAYSVTKMLMLEDDFDFVINMGLAGGMLGNQKMGDILIGEEYVQADFDLTAFGRAMGEVPGSEKCVSDDPFVCLLKKVIKEKGYSYEKGLMASGDVFLADKDRKKAIENEFNPISFDMESAPIAEICGKMEVPFVCLRVVSDNADESAADHFDLSIEQIVDRPVEIFLTAVERM